LVRRLAQGTVLLFLAFAAASAQTPEQQTARQLDAIRKNPSLLLAFLQGMPKGADLHNHLSGAIYAENWIDYAVRDNLCVDRRSLALEAQPCDASCAKDSAKPAVQCAYGDQALYNQLIDAWSMRNWTPATESGHDHFFASFGKFSLASKNSLGDQLAEATERAADNHLQYLELMVTADGSGASGLGTKLGWDGDFQKMRDRLLAGGLKDVIAATRAHVDHEEARQRKILECDTPQAAPACQVTVRYLYQVLRGLPPEQVFAQILLGFELVQADPRFVGLNLVMPEDWYVPMHDFRLHMQMLDILHSVYPKVHISLHAGELAMGLVPPEGLRFHIRESIERGHAERIGHGVSVMNETDASGLLKEMARRKVLVEICLTSNAKILGVAGPDHPLPAYMKYGVPVALATDDEGVSRSDMTHEYLRAVETYGLSYAQIKRMARESLEHSFLPGESLWRGDFQRTPACATDQPEKISSRCRKFLDTREKARQEWELEKQFAAFEKGY
jgi:adenosine deaminase